ADVANIFLSGPSRNRGFSFPLDVPASKVAPDVRRTRGVTDIQTTVTKHKAKVAVGIRQDRAAGVRLPDDLNFIRVDVPVWVSVVDRVPGRERRGVFHPIDNLRRHKADGVLSRKLRVPA